MLYLQPNQPNRGDIYQMIIDLLFPPPPEEYLRREMQEQNRLLAEQNELLRRQNEPR